MPLLPNILQTSLSSFMDDKAANFAGFPSTGSDAADKWSTAIGSYTSGIIPPSSTAQTAKSGMRAALVNMDKPGAASAGLPAAFTAFAVTLAGGMAPAFVAVPPPAPIVIAPIVPTGLSGAPASTVVSQLVSIIDLWFRTGLAAPVPPGTVFIPWS